MRIIIGGKTLPEISKMCKESIRYFLKTTFYENASILSACLGKSKF